MNNDLSQDLLAQYQIVILAASGGYALRSDIYFFVLILVYPRYILWTAMFTHITMITKKNKDIFVTCTTLSKSYLYTVDF